MIFDKVCISCYQPFTSHQPDAKYCPQCRSGKEKDKHASRKYRWKHHNNCVDCGKRITSNAQRCRSCSHTRIGKNQRGVNNPRWKGGKRYETDGYVRVLNKSHPKAAKSGYVLEHILVWEEANKMPVPDGHVIHHLNGIRNDNRISNLVALPRRKHHGELMHQALKKRIKDLEAKLSQQRF